jgi:hydrophobic/amphiphilic exporter-1 (mainly G- bacteria), HAE1 family
LTKRATSYTNWGMVTTKKINTTQPPSQAHVRKDDWNLKLARFFLENGRTTVLAFILFTIIGMAAFFGLKTTGFPEIEIKIALIRTIYPQASAQTVLETVTLPIEQSIKGIKGVERYTSNSSDNFSLVSVNIGTNATKDDVINKITTQLASLKLPDTAQKPIIESISVSGPDYVFSIFGDSVSQAYDTQEAFKTAVKEIPESNTTEITNEIKKIIEVRYNPSDLLAKGISESDITNLLTSANITVPVALNQVVDGKKVNILSSLNAKSVEDLKQLSLTKQLSPSLPPLQFKLSDLVQIEETFRQSPDDVGAIKYTLTDTISQTVTLNVKAKTGTDLTKYGKVLEEKLKDIKNTQFVREAQVGTKSSPVSLIENYSVNTQNKEQVSEIIQGLVGGELKLDNKFIAQFGWLFGALQLVFLVMLVFVSWRAAVIASLSIPLSLLSSMIYLYFTGNSLNTLVLFSFVLVIGLVVDPALVVLEAIQRKKDLGLPGKTAALEAIRDIGPGLFVATLANAVVFIPLAIVSGTLGKIFANIPATILPALVGAYLIPLIFLTAIGAFFLKRAKGKTENETENLWPFAQWLIQFNTKILKGSAWVRLLIIVAVTGLSLGITGWMIGSGKITVAQFSESSDAQFLSLSVVPNNNLTEEQKTKVTEDAFGIILKNSDVVSVYPLQGDYYVNLKTKDNGRTLKAKEIAKAISADLLSIKDRAEATIATVQNGPGTSDYQIQLAIKTGDAAKGAQAAKTLGEIITNSCVVDGTFKFKDCEGKTKVVEKTLDGYADFSQTSLKVVLNKTKLEEKGLSSEQIPGALLVGGQLRGTFPTQSTEAVTKITKVDGTTLEVFTKNTSTPLSSLTALQNYELKNLQGASIKLSEVADIKSETLQTSISRLDSETQTRYQIRMKEGYTDQGKTAAYETGLLEYLKKEGKNKIEESGISTDKITTYSAGGTAEFAKSFGELGLALVLAIIIVYGILVLFMKSFTTPIVVLYTIPITFIGIFPVLGFLSSGQFGFLEIIGLIILTGLVINAAIFLMDASRQKELAGMDAKSAIALASGLRLRPVLLTKFTAVASLSPLVFTSEFYRNLALVIISGIIVSGFLSLITTPILYIAFRRFSNWVSGLGKKKPATVR